MSRIESGSSFAAGIVVGSLGTLGGFLLLNGLGRKGFGHIVRVEKSLQVGCDVEEVFRAWLDLERLPQLSPIIQQVKRSGDRSHWRVNVGGRVFEWDALMEQFIMNQAIGWKSINGAKHSGRITFSPIGKDTLVHVVMNYAPPVRGLVSPFLRSVPRLIDDTIEKLLRDVKAALETGVEHRTRRESEDATGTYGVVSSPDARNLREITPPNPVDFSRPPEAKS